MKKLTAIILALALFMLAGCSPKSAWSSSGILSGEEIALLESQYLKDVSETSDIIGYENVVHYEGGGRLDAQEQRSAGGLNFTQSITYDSDSNGFCGFGMSSQRLTDKAQADKAAMELYADLVKAYGEPVNEDYSPKQSLKDWLEYAQTEEGFEGQPGLVTANASIRWDVGDMTVMGMEVLLVEDRYYVISLDYGLQTVVDGQPLDAESLKERVRGFQEEG